jgi:nucleotide-binding universal stress UspA family protein
MSCKTILAAASGGTASDGVMELACRLARRFEAHVEGFHIRIDPRQVLMAAADGFGMPLLGGWIDELTAEAAATAAKTKVAFDAAIARHGLAMADVPPKIGASAAWRDETGYAPVLVARRARFFDLVVLGRSERVINRAYTDAVEEALIRSGRPVLLAPAQPPSAIGETIALGWNGSPEAVRALAAALPFLAAARAVSIITIGGDREAGEIASVLDYLAWQGIAATHRYLRPVSGVSAGEQLLAEAREAAADLLVMGAYGHMPWRELLLGGATRDVLGVSLLPVLLSH